MEEIAEKSRSANTSLRRKTYLILEAPTLRYKWHWVNVFLMVLIGLNVVAIALESVNSIRQYWFTGFAVFDIFSVAVFTVEYVARLWSCVENPRYHHLSPFKARLRYAVTPMALVDLMAILPFYLNFFIDIDLRALRALRLTRVLKFTRYADSLNLIRSVFREEAPMFISAIGIFLIIVILSATGMYFFEHKAQPDVFSSIPQGMWWAITTITTVGYGDVVPITIAGKIFGSLVMMLGVGMLGLTTGVVASAFSDEMRTRRQIYKMEIRRALIDGAISESERSRLVTLRERLKLSEFEGEHLLHQAINEEQIGVLESLAHKKCPHCGKRL